MGVVMGVHWGFLLGVVGVSAWCMVVRFWWVWFFMVLGLMLRVVVILSLLRFRW